MNFKDAVKWRTRMYALYALGMWTTIGSYAFLTSTGRFEDPSVKKEEEELEDPNYVVYKSVHFKTVIIYKKDFVPYSTRFYNFITSFSSEPGRGDRDQSNGCISAKDDER